MLKTLLELTPAQQQELWQFFAGFGPQPPFPDAAVMRRALAAPMFAEGREYLTFWGDDGEVTGAIGLVTREAETKGELFLVAPHVRPVGALTPVLTELWTWLRARDGLPPGVVVKLGLREEMSGLEPPLKRLGFRLAYRAVELEQTLSGEPAAASRPEPVRFEPVRFEPVTAANVADYVAVKNAAFLHAPNGATTDVAEVLAEIETAAHPDLHLLGYVPEGPAVVLELALSGVVGEIDGLGVDPGSQGRGLGRVGLHKAMAVLQAHGAVVARLQVIDANTPALRLYEAEGFSMRRQVTRWFIGPPLIHPLR